MVGRKEGRISERIRRIIESENSMNLKRVKEILYDVTAMFFKGATILWTEQNNTKPPLPYITLKVSGISKSTFPIIDDEGNRYYPCNTILEVNLYTKGSPVTIGNNVTGSYENTATSDLMDFFKFLESDIMIDYLAEKGVDILLIPPIRDLTALENDRAYRYRAMAEATISWSENADGSYGIGGMSCVPNSSGGGTEEMANRTEDYFTSVEIEEIEGGSENGEE